MVQLVPPYVVFRYVTNNKIALVDPSDLLHEENEI